MICSLLPGSESTNLAEIWSAEWRVQPPINTAALFDDTHTTTEAVESHLCVKSTNAWMTPDFPDPPRKSMSWGVGIIFFTRAWIFGVRREMQVDGLPVLLLLANATGCNRAALINTNAKCCFSFKPQCSECCVGNGCPRYLIRYRKRN